MRDPVGLFKTIINWRHGECTHLYQGAGHSRRLTVKRQKKFPYCKERASWDIVQQMLIGHAALHKC